MTGATFLVLAIIAIAIYAMGRHDSGASARPCRHCGHLNGAHRAPLDQSKTHDGHGYCYPCRTCYENAATHRAGLS